MGSGGDGTQTGRIMIEFERVLQETKADIAVVVGNVNSPIARGLVCCQKRMYALHTLNRTCVRMREHRSLPELWDSDAAERIVRIPLQERTGFDT